MWRFRGIAPRDQVARKLLIEVPLMAQESTSMPLFDTASPKPLLMIMDGHAMVHRSFRAIATQRHLTVSTTGEDVTGVYGFTNVFLRALQDWKPTHYAIAFDTPAPTFRHQRFEEYKAQREPSPPELRPQFWKSEGTHAGLRRSRLRSRGF